MGWTLNAKSVKSSDSKILENFTVYPIIRGQETLKQVQHEGKLKVSHPGLWVFFIA